MSTSSNKAPQIEQRRPGDLKPYARNARTHSKKQVRQIADSIQRFGFTNPVLISDNEDFYEQMTFETKNLKDQWNVKLKLDWDLAPPKKFDIKI